MKNNSFLIIQSRLDFLIKHNDEVNEREFKEAQQNYLLLEKAKIRCIIITLLNLIILGTIVYFWNNNFLTVIVLLSLFINMSLILKLIDCYKAHRILKGGRKISKDKREIRIQELKKVLELLK